MPANGRSRSWEAAWRRSRRCSPFARSPEISWTWRSWRHSGVRIPAARRGGAVRARQPPTGSTSSQIARDQGRPCTWPEWTASSRGEQRIVTWDGRSFDYDLLLVAGARPDHRDPGQRHDPGPGLHQPLRDHAPQAGQAHGDPGGVRGSRRHILAPSALRARPAHRHTCGRARTPQGHASARHARIGAARAVRPTGLRGGAGAARPARRGADHGSRAPRGARGRARSPLPAPPSVPTPW